MSTTQLKDPEYIKPLKKIIDTIGREQVIPERRVKFVDDRILPHELEKIASKLKLSDDEKLQLQILNDPVLWASTHLSNPENSSEFIDLRFYQTDFLETPSRYKVLRLGRQIGKTIVMGVDILWRAYTHPGYKVVIVAPFMAQVGGIMTKMKAMIGGVSPLKDHVKKLRENPPEIVFDNGSTIKGFVAGESVAGQSANMLCWDESDYISDYDKSRIEPVVNNFPDHIIIQASTPTGKRDAYYRTCVEQNAYVEFHYSSHASPMWSDDMDQQYREKNSRASYIHEIMAEFGSPESGVFKGTDIEACINFSKFYKTIDKHGKEIPRSYTYSEFYQHTSKIEKKPTFLIGVDWNAANNGTQIVVLAVMDKIYVANVVSIAGHEFTQTKAVEIIAELNDQYDPLAIYVDVGYGGMQIETLHLYGKANPSTKLHKKVIGIDFASKIEIPNKVTGESTKKRMKQFMIDRFQRLLENHEMVIPEQEDLTGGLAEEMRNFTIERYGVDGSPIYGKDSPDHKLFACALAVLAYAVLIDKVDRYDYLTELGKVTNDVFGNVRAKTLSSGVCKRSNIPTSAQSINDEYIPAKTMAGMLNNPNIKWGGITNYQNYNNDHPKAKPSQRNIGFNVSRNGRSRF